MRSGEQELSKFSLAVEFFLVRSATNWVTRLSYLVFTIRAISPKLSTFNKLHINHHQVFII